MFGDMITVNGSGSSSQETSFAVGFDINNYSTSTAEQAGIIHWGGVPNGGWTGNLWVGYGVCQPSWRLIMIITATGWTPTRQWQGAGVLASIP